MIYRYKNILNIVIKYVDTSRTLQEIINIVVGLGFSWSFLPLKI